MTATAEKPFWMFRRKSGNKFILVFGLKTEVRPGEQYYEFSAQREICHLDGDPEKPFAPVVKRTKTNDTGRVLSHTDKVRDDTGRDWPIYRVPTAFAEVKEASK